MVRWLRRRPAETPPRTCRCGAPLDTRVVGVVQRAGAEPINVAWCWHCAHCGDVEPPSVTTLG
jgi:hypothetical protein